MTKEQTNLLTGQLLDSCIEVHRELGPGLLESVYFHALCHELNLRQISFRKNVGLQLFYKGHATGKFFEMDLVVEDTIVVELKSVEHMLPVFEAQLLSYLKLSDKRVGLLINFNMPKLIDGFKRMVNNF